MRKEVAVAAVATVSTVVVAGVLLVRWKKRDERRWKQTQRMFRKFANDCATPVPKLWHVAFDLVSDMQTSLSDQSQTDYVMLPSVTSSLPSGTEEGLYYGVNLREDNFLMMRARLRGRNDPITDLDREEVEIPPEVISGTYKELFDYIALKLAVFISINTKTNPIAPKGKMGFTVSFPLHDGPAAAGANVIRWKSFPVNEAAGKELAKDFNEALEKHGIDLRVTTLVDATLGDLSGGRYYNRDCVAAVTLGLATNAVYVESAQFVPNGGVDKNKFGEMVIDMQWGKFNTPHLPITQFDMALDSESSNPGSRIFEKLIGGRYLGEVVRRVLLKMAKETALFGETVPDKLKTPYILRSPDMAAMHQDTSENRDAVQEKLMEVFGIASTSLAVRELVTEVCDVVAERGARLAGACIVGIMKKRGRINDKKSVVIIEGGLYEHYRVFRNLLHSSIWEMLGGALADNVIVEHAHGGSGAGAIFVAAAHSQIRHESFDPPLSEIRNRKGNDDDDQMDLLDWKDDQSDSASLKGGDQMDSTAETSDHSDSSDAGSKNKI
ncbi:putative hexokinase, ATPase, nucleotide binding domain-containing protein [Helianthus debilis subsp. tardiflorus]